MIIKLNENTNSGMLYAIAYCEDPDIYSEDFWGWDTESDVGYELMEFGSLIQDADVFDSLEAAEDRADDVLSSIFENEVFIVGLDPYTPHNLTGFVKKITRRTMSENYCVYSSSNNGCYKEFTGTEDACNSWIKNNKWRFPAFVNLKVQPESEPAKWLRDFDTTESKSINESSDSEYWYFTKHGVQPGSIPNNIDVLEIKDTPDGTYFKGNRVLTTKELQDYEIKEKSPEMKESIERAYKMVEYTYDGDNVSDYLDHVRVRTNSDEVALRAAEKYAMNKHSEDNPGHFKIVDDNYTNVDVIDSDGDYLTTLESVDESKSIKEGLSDKKKSNKSNSTFDRTSTDFSWSTDWCNCGAEGVFPHMMFATDIETVFWDGPYGYRLRGEVFAENPNVFHAYIVRYDRKSEYEVHGQGGKIIAEKEYIESLDAAKAFIEDWFTNSFDSYVKPENESLNESKSIKESNKIAYGNEKYKGYMIRQDHKYGGYNVYDKEDEMEDSGFTTIDKAKEFIDSLEESKSIKESATGDYVEVAYICDGFTNFRVFGGGFKTSDALVAVEDEKGKRLRLTMGDVCEFYTWYDAKGNVIHEPTYYSED